MDAVIDFLNGVPLVAFMLVVAVGYTIGRVSWHGLSLGPAAGTLGVAILLGALGLDYRAMYGSEGPPFTLGALGFALFLYSVGFEAGPRFFGYFFGRRGLRYVLVGSSVVVLAFFAAWGLGTLFDLGGALTAGILSGALTSAAAYAAALEVVHADPALAGPLAVSFALSYPIGLVAFVFVVQLLPRLRRPGTAGRDDDDLDEPATGAVVDGVHAELTRAFEIRAPDVAGRTLAELDLPHRSGVYVTQIHRGEEVLPATGETTLESGDHILVRGRLDELEALATAVGPEVYDATLRARMPAPRRVVVLTPEAVGRTLRQLYLGRRHGCLVVGLERGAVYLEPTAEMELERGDVLDVIGRRDDVRRAAKTLGRLERSSHETDIGVYAGGIALGALIGHLSIHVAGVELSLGVAGGLLLAGILLGRARRIGPFSTHVPRPARLLVRELGILLFVAEAGVQAGNSPLGALEGRLGALLLTTIALSLLPALGALLLAHRALGMRRVDALGSVAGGMTSSAALAAVRRVSEGHDPAVSYAAAYAVASVLVTVAGRVLMFVM